MLIATERPDVSDISSPVTDPGEYEFASLMKAREDALHSIFGHPFPDGNILVDATLAINYPGGGIYQYPPREHQSDWHYVTSGLSQPLKGPESDLEEEAIPLLGRYSGLGIELVISTREQANWPIAVLFNLVRYLILQKDSRVILPGDCVPCGGPLVQDIETPLSHLLAVRSPNYETELVLPEGRCDLVHLVGVTDAEIQKALTLGRGDAGSIILAEVLQEFAIGTTSIPTRSCLSRDPKFEATWTRIQMRCEAEWKAKEKSD